MKKRGEMEAETGKIAGRQVRVVELAAEMVCDGDGGQKKKKRVCRLLAAGAKRAWRDCGKKVGEMG